MSELAKSKHPRADLLYRLCSQTNGELPTIDPNQVSPVEGSIFAKPILEVGVL